MTWRNEIRQCDVCKAQFQPKREAQKLLLDPLSE